MPITSSDFGALFFKIVPLSILILDRYLEVLKKILQQNRKV